MQRQAGISEIRHVLEQKLTSHEAQHLQLTYEDEGRLPAAAIVRVKGIELRLEKDHFDGCWTVATNEGAPRLLNRLDQNQLGPRMIMTLQESVEQLRG